MSTAATYHRGEHAVQKRVGLDGPAGNAVRGIRDAVPAVAAEFLAEQPAVFLGAADRAGRIWSTMLTGEPGFLSAPRADLVVVRNRPEAPDPLAEALAGPARLGMIAIEPATRRRMRINGRSRPYRQGLAIEIEQVIANCPKYIQKRSPEAVAAGPARLVARGAALTDRQRAVVEAADTFFVSTAADDGAADTSHRGGRPGFVRVTSPTRLSWPDYLGNAMFLTLGNLELNPAAGLLFPDWSTGGLLHLSGTAAVDYSPDRAARVPGAQRLVDFTVTDVVEVTGGSPLRWSAPEPSRFNPPTSTEVHPR
ncbi:putative pyridoxine 5'-phosphate oxidase superfamily flavin-nucleotide-binding protein [Actinoplanes octamycinicus]|uniref:Putative pyridoxine 5'-phosphate oxidase superfamily flavin-nucleotide-binding protein n=1 Tax=Actinoplanes octamycinicus TaxID=135948 RepID=A0A7W7H3H6_9ACTN|nr:pyridoxamine 5'-phosphate oxidase family protein [Actinoplanes octamycinicus]MBB4743114.1 putative pyridoxine 5'-phosphate oxidase superfamily flavin-nucleotide-binding protein [Actinoplanes octamycinicus]GIE61324.1 hypothetical protein Aoc01nite_67260 [Actinoplanes octamycinicus]